MTPISPEIFVSDSLTLLGVTHHTLVYVNKRLGSMEVRKVKYYMLLLDFFIV